MSEALTFSTPNGDYSIKFHPGLFRGHDFFVSHATREIVVADCGDSQFDLIARTMAAVNAVVRSQSNSSSRAVPVVAVNPCSLSPHVVRPLVPRSRIVEYRPRLQSDPETEPGLFAVPVPPSLAAVEKLDSRPMR